MAGDHHIPIKTYLLVLTGLLALTVVTVAVSRWDFGAFNGLIAMLIASIKGGLVLWYFMHLKMGGGKLYGAIFGLSVFFVLILFLLIKADVATRVLERAFL